MKFKRSKIKVTGRQKSQENAEHLAYIVYLLGPLRRVWRLQRQLQARPSLLLAPKNPGNWTPAHLSTLKCTYLCLFSISM